MKICNICKNNFYSLIEEYDICTYCWYESLYGNTLVKGYKYKEKDNNYEV
jgi:hypothetical protein